MLTVLLGKGGKWQRVPAVDEVRDGVVDAEGGCVQVSTDFHIVSSHQANGGLVLIIKDLPLE